MKKLVCECGNTKFCKADHMLATDPPIQVYFCSTCGKQYNMHSPAPVQEPVEIWIKEES